MSAGSEDPTLTLPASEQLSANGTLFITGINYTDTIAVGNPGAMFLSISDTSGLLSASDTQGVVPGWGTNTLTVNASYNDVQDVLHSLNYAASPNAGSDTINFDLWDQYGIEITGTLPVTINPSNPANETWTGAVSGDWNTPGNWSGDAVPVSGDTVSIPGGTPNSATLANATLSGETITLSNDATVNFTNVTVDSVLQAANSLNTLKIGGSLTIGAQGLLGTEQNGDLIVTTGGSAVPIVNNGTISDTSGFLTFDNGGSNSAATLTLQNNGLISASGGGGISIDFNPSPFGTVVKENLINSGSVVIGDGGGLSLDGTISGNNVSFTGAGTLSLQQPDAFAGNTEISGFGPGDQVVVYGQVAPGAYHFTNGTLTTGTAAAVPFSGDYGLGNFEASVIGSQGRPEAFAYAPDDAPGGVLQPDIVAPTSESVAPGGTLSPGISIVNAGSTVDSLQIGAVSGTLFMNGATGSGTNRLSLGTLSTDQVNADLASLTYVPAARSSSDLITVNVSPPAPLTTIREIPIGVTAVSTGPTLTEPASEAVAAGGTVAVNGSYADSFAQNNPGQLFLGINDSGGTLTATDASGNPVAGSGTSNIALSTDYVDLNAILAGLSYTASGTAGTDTIQFDVWNQAGVETTGSTAVTIGAAMTAADFAPSLMSPGTVAATGTGGGAPVAAMSTPTIQPMAMPFVLGH